MPLVKSSHLRSVKYDDDKKKMTIRFHDQSVYEFEDVSKSENTKILKAVSKGKKFWRTIRDIKPTTKIKQGVK